MDPITYSLVIPVYRNQASLPELLENVSALSKRLGSLEVIFVIDGSPDDSWKVLNERLPTMAFPSQLLTHSRNFGSFAAIRTGLEQARGTYCAVQAADLQEPPELIEEIFRTLAGKPADVVIGVRRRRSDPWMHRVASSLFWFFYKRWVQPDMPRGGIDVFGCNRFFCETLSGLKESNTTLVGLIIWMGFRRMTVTYDRLPRRHGASGWTFRRKIRYMFDSLFAFSDLPIYGMILLGAFGIALSAFLATAILIAKQKHLIQVPGYTATILTIMFFGALNSLGLGIIGSYVWRTFENTKGRPASLIMSKVRFPPDHGG